jgi:hypothetical protein
MMNLRISQSFSRHWVSHKRAKGRQHVPIFRKDEGRRNVMFWDRRNPFNFLITGITAKWLTGFLGNDFNIKPIDVRK